MLSDQSYWCHPSVCIAAWTWVLCKRWRLSVSLQGQSRQEGPRLSRVMAEKKTKMIPYLQYLFSQSFSAVSLACSPSFLPSPANPHPFHSPSTFLSLFNSSLSLLIFFYTTHQKKVSLCHKAELTVHPRLAVGQRLPPLFPSAEFSIRCLWKYREHVIPEVLPCKSTQWQLCPGRCWIGLLGPINIVFLLCSDKMFDLCNVIHFLAPNITDL